MKLLAAIAHKNKATNVRKRPAAATAVDFDGDAEAEVNEENYEDEEDAADTRMTLRKKPVAAPVDSGIKKRRRPPRMDYELTRNNILVRTGLTGRGQAGSRSFGFGPGRMYKDMKAAETAAKEFVKELIKMD